MEQATLNVSDILESDRLDAAEIERLRQAAFSGESAWRELREAVSEPTKSHSMAKRVKRGAGLLILGRAAAAARELEDVKAGQDATGALVLGRAYLELGEPAKAAEAFEAGLKKAKNDFDLLAASIEAQRDGGDVSGALREAKELAKKFNERAEALYQLGACFEAAGDYSKAMDAWEEALERDASHARALFRLAYNHELRGSLGLAEDYYKRCTSLTPTYPAALVNYGLLLEDQSRFKDAIEVYHRVLEVQPNHPRARLFLKDAEASLDMYYDEDQEKKSDRRNAILRIPVTDFELSVRARNCLNKMNIRNLGDLVTKTEEELLAYKNFGETSLQEIKQMLAQKGLRLGMFREDATETPVVAADEPLRTGDEETLKKPIAELELSVRSRNCMERLNIRTIGELCSRSEQDLLAVKNFGQTSLNEIKQRLGELGLSLAPDSGAGASVAATSGAAAFLRAIAGTGPLDAVDELGGGRDLPGSIATPEELEAEEDDDDDIDEIAGDAE